MDRSQRMHNPNYPPTLQQYAHPIPQPPAQPTADPFTRVRRDPFLAAPSSDKRDAQFSHAVYPSNGASRIDTLQPAPAPPPSPFHAGRGPTFRDDHHGRRGSSTYTSGPLEPPPPPQPPITGVMSRQMPPPASSPKQSPGPSYSHSLSRGSLPNPSSFNPGRDPGAGYPSHRPSSSMSIQSIMGSDSAIAPKGPPLWAPFGSRTPQTGSGPYAQPSSPPYDRRPAFQNDSNVESRPRTPERRVDYGAPFARPPNATSPIVHPIPQGGLPDHHNMTRLMQPNHHSGAPNQGLPPRPYSQPGGPEGGGRNQGGRYGYEPGPPPPPPAQGLPGDRNIHGQHHPNGSVDKTPRDRSMSDLDSRRGSSLSQPVQRSMHESVFMSNAPPAQLDHLPYTRRQDYLNGTSKLDRTSTSHLAHTHEIPRPRSPPISQAMPIPATQQPTAPTFTPGFMPIDHAIMNRPLNDRLERASFASSAQGSEGGLNGLPGGRRTPAIDAQLRKSIEDNQAAQRSFLSIASDHARMLDRASPLPQAVQGAQSQPVGSNRDPSIKSEFGRMFSGLGSGVGSTPVPSSTYAPPTPANRSPIIEEVDGEPAMRKASVGSRAPTAASRGGRRGKRAYDDDGRIDSESGDGRATPVGSVRGGKRNKYTLPGHHHHHVPNSLHHHHIHRKADEETTPVAPQSSTNSPFNTFKFPANTPTSSTTAAAAVPHHHHHHHPLAPHHHHHHHPPKGTNPVPQTPALRLPTTTILTKPLVQTVSHLPRHHLGSQLYAPTIDLPSTGTTTLGSATTYTTIPNALPRFEGRENCTFTIRVPRYYLTHGPRQNICSARRVWGTDVYTDDSDPVAAAIHSGWIKGAWPENVDVDLLTLDPAQQVPEGALVNPTTDADDLEPKPQPTDNNKSKPDTTTVTTPPTTRLLSPPSTGPTTPPPNTDLHLTLLILPTLEKYTSSVWHGVKSRAWGRNHDGVSFKVERVEWVDEGWEGRGKERGAEARRRRLVGERSSVANGGVGLKGVLEGLRVAGKGFGVGSGVRGRKSGINAMGMGMGGGLRDTRGMPVAA